MATTELDTTKQANQEILDSMSEALVDIGQNPKGLTLVEDKKVDFTRDFSARIMQLPEWGSDRGLDQFHVAELKLEMERGTFLGEQTQIITCSWNGTEHRMNGQHTCLARWNYENNNYSPKVRWLRYTAKTEDDMRLLYSLIDNIKARTQGDKMVALLYQTPAFTGFSKATIISLGQGFAFWQWEAQHHRNRHDAKERSFRLKNEYYELAKNVGEFLKNCSKKEHSHLMRRPVVAAMFATFDKAKGNALKFWESVKSGIGFEHTDDPRRKLLMDLMRSSILTMNNADPDKRNVSSEEMYRWCIHAWNNWRSGQSQKVLRVNLSKPRPEVK